MSYRETQLKGFVLGDEDLEVMGVNPERVTDLQFEDIAERVTEVLQEHFQTAVSDALKTYTKEWV